MKDGSFPGTILIGMNHLMIRGNLYKEKREEQNKVKVKTLYKQRDLLQKTEGQKFYYWIQEKINTLDSFIIDPRLKRELRKVSPLDATRR